MKSGYWAFNLYFIGLLGSLLGVLLGSAACQTGKGKDFSSLRVHIETHPDPAGRDGRNRKVLVFRKDPKEIFIDRSPFLDEGHLKAAELVETEKGFHIRLVLDRTGRMLLENMTAMHTGRRLVIFSRFDDTGRWLAAPVIHGRITDGQLRFVPDATRAEAETIVEGLKRVVEETRNRSWL